MGEKTVTLKLRDVIVGGLTLALVFFFALQLIGIRAALGVASKVVTIEQSVRDINALNAAVNDLNKRFQELEKAK